MGYIAFSVTSLWILEVCIILLLHSCGIYLLVTQERRKVQDIILIQLSVCECLSIIWDMAHYKQTIFSSDDMTSDNWTGVLVIWIAIFLSIAALTMDRFLAVKLNIKYGLHVTIKRALITLAVTWIIALAHVVHYWYFDLSRHHVIFLAWECALLLLIISVYTFIFVSVRLRWNQIHRAGVPGLTQRPLNYKIPALIVVSFVCFVSLLDLLQFFGVEYKAWLSLVYNLNFLTDAAVYILGSPRTRRRLFKYWTSDSQTAPRPSTIVL